MNNNELIFYPKHPSSLKTHKIETRPMPILEQDGPFYAKELCNEFSNDLEGALEIYEDKRFEVTGIASKIGPDIHNKPSIEISDEVGGQCYTLCIFPTDDFYKEVSVGDKVTVRANYLVMSNWYGVVMKYSELINVEKKQNENTVCYIEIYVAYRILYQINYLRLFSRIIILKAFLPIENNHNLLKDKL